MLNLIGESFQKEEDSWSFCLLWLSFYSYF